MHTRGQRRSVRGVQGPHLLSMLPMLLARHALTVSLKATSEKLPSRPNATCGRRCTQQLSGPCQQTFIYARMTSPEEA
jgi:hypothetical protein